jgi:DNA-binding NtrC family response regulator
MSEHLFALLIHNQAEPFESLKQTLTELSIQTYSVATCKEAENLISQCKPHIIFAEYFLQDGGWSNILNIADSANVPLNVIVVSSHPDSRLYLSVMERGPFDFIAPPFERESLGFVVRSAVLNSRRLREALAHAGVA